MAISATDSATVYVGPSLPHGVLPRYTIFRGALPAHIAALAAQSPALRGLIVPVAELARAKQRVSTQGDLLNIYAGRVAREVKTI